MSACRQPPARTAPHTHANRHNTRSVTQRFSQQPRCTQFHEPMQRDSAGPAGAAQADEVADDPSGGHDCTSDDRQPNHSRGGAGPTQGSGQQLGPQPLEWLHMNQHPELAGLSVTQTGAPGGRASPSTYHDHCSLLDTGTTVSKRRRLLFRGMEAVPSSVPPVHAPNVDGTAPGAGASPTDDGIHAVASELGSAGSRKVCESLVLDSPKTLLSKTPDQIAEIAKQMRKGKGGWGLVPRRPCVCGARGGGAGTVHGRRRAVPSCRLVPSS